MDLHTTGAPDTKNTVREGIPYGTLKAFFRKRRGVLIAVLCQHEEIATTDPGDSYCVLGLEQDGVLRTWVPWEDGPLVFLTVSPARFLGYGLRACYEGGSNRFLFRGILECGEGRGYHIRLVTWDIAAPVCRPPVYNTPVPSYYRRWLFPRDFWWPDPLGGLP